MLGDAGGLGEEVVHRHAVALRGRVVGEVPRDGRVERDLAGLDQLEHEGRRELLRE